ncbi:hypothetical protein IAT40_005810 [Kwoniella sp. CBS 6097]
MTGTDIDTGDTTGETRTNLSTESVDISTPSRPSVSSSRTQSRYIVTVANSFDVDSSTLATLEPNLDLDHNETVRNTLQKGSESSTQTVVRTRTITLPEDHEDIDTQALVQDEDALEELIAKSEKEGKVQTKITTSQCVNDGSQVESRDSSADVTGDRVSTAVLASPANGSFEVPSVQNSGISTGARTSTSSGPALAPLNVTRSPPTSLVPFGLSYTPVHPNVHATVAPEASLKTPAAAIPVASTKESRFGDIVLKDPLNLSLNAQLEPAPSYDLPGGRGPWLYRLFLKIAYFSLVYGMRYFFYAVFAWFTLGILWIVLPFVLCGGALKGVWGWVKGYVYALGGKLWLNLTVGKGGYPWWSTDNVSKPELIEHERHGGQATNPVAATIHGHGRYSPPTTGRRRSSNPMSTTNDNTNDNDDASEENQAVELGGDVAVTRAEAFIKLEETANVASKTTPIRRSSGQGRIAALSTGGKQM